MSLAFFLQSPHILGLAHSTVPQAYDLHVVISIVFLLVQLTGFGSVLGHWLLAATRGSVQGRGLVTVWEDQEEAVDKEISP